jgi:multidrug efflux pump subunit AcrA (membrane-fusion protein)
MPLPKKRFWLFYTYAVLSWLYGYWVIYKLVVFMKPHLDPLGLGDLTSWFSAFALISWVAMPFIGFFKGMNLTHEDWKQGGRLRRLGAIGAAALGIFIAACFYPKELVITRAGTVELANPEEVRPQVSGFIEEVFVKEGDHVMPGTPLAKLKNRDADQLLVEARARLKTTEAAVQRALGEGRPADLKEAQAVKEAYEKKVQDAERDVHNLTVVSHTDGVVLTRDLERATGRLIRSGELFCEVAPLDPLRIKIALSEKQVRYVEKGEKVELRAHAFPSREYHGVIAERPVMFFGQDIPRGFSKKYGGDVLTYTDHQGREIPVERTFEAVLEVQNPEGSLRPGMTVRGKIYAGTHSWGRLVAQSILDLWSLDYRFFF